uniref:Uracil-DNA glycosylase n=1 Tax=Polytomella parva TaxID=51329 RepID=A0A7S0YJJ8_9CHLO|mmetsp:Transcript_29705/g.54463  ORF Transcript_29705/g.54463 Transcript_29705/m.54463 type:complete len:380 (+) Transcript_29705:108-1247(+)
MKRTINSYFTVVKKAASDAVSQEAKRLKTDKAIDLSCKASQSKPDIMTTEISVTSTPLNADESSTHEVLEQLDSKSEALKIKMDDSTSPPKPLCTTNKTVLTPAEIQKIANENALAVQAIVAKYTEDKKVNGSDNASLPLLSLLVEDGWRNVLSSQSTRPYFNKLQNFMDMEWKNTETSSTAPKIFPPKPNIFRAFNSCPFSHVKVVLLGQDPYHGPGQAMGLSFSVPKGVLPPPSLQNIFKEIEDDLKITMPRSGGGRKANGDLSKWSTQGVLLLNAVLSVRCGMAASHQKKGWEELTDAAIEAISQRHKKGVVFMLWGNFAIAKSKLIDKERHQILTAAHPSPLSAHRGFFGCKHFSKANAYLVKMGRDPVDWSLDL